MTFALARQFGARILIVSDTMTTNRNLTRNDIIPGELKAIVLNDKISVAYSGLVPLALDAIKQSAAACKVGKSICNIIKPLQAASAKTFGTEYQTEFLVVSHLPNPSMLKVWQDGEVLERSDRLRIGEQEAVNCLDDFNARFIEHIPDSENRFMFAVAMLAAQPAGLANIAVGGFLITLLASPIGHGYQDVVGVTVSDTIQGGQALTEAQLADRASGMTQYQYRIIAGFWRGAAIVGAYIDQPRLGYLYHPLQEKTVDSFVGLSVEEFIIKHSSAAKAAGAEQRA